MLKLIDEIVGMLVGIAALCVLLWMLVFVCSALVRTIEPMEACNRPLKRYEAIAPGAPLVCWLRREI